jgi:threonine dehydrogenase-like Zn-dependent dehydrogenase
LPRKISYLIGLPFDFGYNPAVRSGINAKASGRFRSLERRFPILGQVVMKQIVQNIRSGKTMVLEVPVPKPSPGMLLIRNAASLVSAGTERMVVEFAAKSMLGKAQSRPDLVRQTLNKARREGLLTTVDAVQNRLNQPMASAGTVIAVGEGVTRYRLGDRVACAGGGYAVHAEYVIVPENLLSLLADNVAFENGAFATLAAIALHGFRLAQPQVGERVAVIGLGLVGLLAVEIAQAAGCKVFGIDLDPTRVELARNLGAKAVIRDEAAAAASSESSGEGFDIVLICADTSSSDPIELAGAISRDRARIVAVGAVGMDLPRKVYYGKELTFMVSRSYGPGRYDHRYEEEGIDYPIGYIRWTEGRNLEAVVQMMAAGRLDVQPLISHRFPIERGIEAYDLITGKKNEAFLGVLLTYPQAEQVDLSMRRIKLSQAPPPAESVVCLGAIGAGNFATAVLFPALRHVKSLDLVGLATATGIKSAAAGRRFGFRYATTLSPSLPATTCMLA